MHEFPDPQQHDNIVYNPSFDELREFSRELETTTRFGSPAYISADRSRNYEKTKNNVEDEITAGDREHLQQALTFLRENEVICVDRQLGRRKEVSRCCRLFIPKKQSRIALAWAKLLEPADTEPDYYTVQLPDWERPMIRTFPADGATYVLGSDYTGETKMSFLRIWLYDMKKQGALGMHAGSKRLTLMDDEERTVGQLYLGLSATGKTTLTGHGFWLEEPEQAEMLQDDICALTSDGAAPGTEGGGLYVKTVGLTEEEQPELYHAVTQSHAVLENVVVDEDGAVDFFDTELTRNGRATVLREDLESAADDIDLEQVDQIFFITRNPVMPPIGKLSPDQAAAAFMLGESVETEAGDPEHAGEQVHVVGTNPFIIGSPGEEGNRFLELVRGNGIDCFVINTGKEDDQTPIEVADTVTILQEVARGRVTWKADPVLGFQIPETVPGMDIDAFYPPDHVTDFERRLAAVRQDRRDWLARFDDLRDEIRNAAY